LRTLLRPHSEKEFTKNPEEKVEVVEWFSIVDESLKEAKLQREGEVQEQQKDFIAEKFEEINEVMECQHKQLVIETVTLQNVNDGTTRTNK
jgi:hypothetical protein